MNMRTLDDQSSSSSSLGNIQEWGSHCSLKSCNTLDFLPIRCESCFKPFCSDHFRPSTKSNETSTHQCQIYTFQQQQQQQQLTTLNNPDSSKLQGFNKRLPICSQNSCKTTLIQPIRCPNCRLDYCPRHRLNSDHSCTHSSISTPPSNSDKPNSSNHFTVLNTRFGSLNPTQLFLKKPSTSLLISSPSDRPLTKTVTDRIKISTASNNVNTNEKRQTTDRSTGLFSKLVDGKRADLELESKRTALEFRAERGILSDRDKLELIELQRQRKTVVVVGSSSGGGKSSKPHKDSLNRTNLRAEDGCIVS
ncbi:hypothetical protein BY996DRAFT_8278363 [Phakopsora pachyrhizi]|nr:hypothetical protein BY996DRAFT_8278363 [Phakopsora pachyrhizi]